MPGLTSRTLAQPRGRAGVLLSAGLVLQACSDGASTSSESPPTALDTTSVVYDFTRGDSLAPRGGWVFHSPSWKLDTVPGSGGVRGLPFTYPGVSPGEYGMSEMRFSMARGDDFWISLRWHVPSNYHHRHDTRLEIPLAQRGGWTLGDTIEGSDGASLGVISHQDSTGIFLRFAQKSYFDQVWNGPVRNRARGATATASGRSQWPANNKLLAVWADDYSARGTGSTIIWGTDLDWASGEKASILTVGYSTGGRTVSGAPASGGILIRPRDSGRWIDLVFHGRFSTGDGARDGIIETWFRRQDEAGWTKALDIATADLNRPEGIADSLRTWGYGYLMGWANSGYDRTTTFHISRLQHGRVRPALLGNAP
jgi:hypothetical protein